MVTLLILHPELLRVTRKVFSTIYAEPSTRRILVDVILTLLAASTFLVTLGYSGNIIRPNLNAIITFDTGASGNFEFGKGVPAINIDDFLMWAPHGAIHDIFLRFDNKVGAAAGVDHRYIGLVTLPLMFAAAIHGYRNRMVWVFLLTVAACLLLVTLTYQNLFMRAIMQSMGILGNIRTIADTLPRDGPAILLMLVAGIGLDEIIRDHHRRYRRTQLAHTAERMLQVGLLCFSGLAAYYVCGYVFFRRLLMRATRLLILVCFFLLKPVFAF